MATEPGQHVLTILNQLVDRIQSTRPVRTDGKSVLTTGFVYSQLVLGMPVNPRDFMNPGSPSGGATLQDTLAVLRHRWKWGLLIFYTPAGP